MKPPKRINPNVDLYTGKRLAMRTLTPDRKAYPQSRSVSASTATLNSNLIKSQQEMRKLK
jgi:hypothetical protein